MPKFIRILGSLPFALFLIAALAVCLSISTFMESAYGTPFAQKLIYNAGWFDIFLSLVWTNIFCATLTRWPFKKRHIGFVITHIGILTLLIGALLSRILGVEGQMSLFENDAKSFMLQQGWELRITDEKGQMQIEDLKLKKLKAPLAVPLKNSTQNLSIYKMYENAKVMQIIEEGSAKDPINHALRVHLSSERVGMNENLWLIEKSPEDPHSFFKTIGPATVELKVKDGVNSKTPKLLLHSKKYEKSFTLDLLPGLQKNIPLKDSDWTLTDLRYFGHARIDKNEIVEDPASVPFNPAVQFTIRNSKNQAESHTRFLLFPDFATLKGGASKDVFGLEVVLLVPNPDQEDEVAPSPSLTFFVRNGIWSYKSTSSKGSGAELPLEKDKAMPTGWMDMTFEASGLYSRAKMKTDIQELKPLATAADNTPAVLLAFKATAVPPQEKWLHVDSPAEFQTPDGEIKILLRPKSYKLPFALKLLDFRKIDYPGTTQAAEFESDVVLFDPVSKLTIERKISMNKPLDYKGFRIFQASYGMDPEFGETSVFSIAKNPGIPLIYSGSLVILVGVIILFYLHPFFTTSVIARSAATKQSKRK